MSTVLEAPPSREEIVEIQKRLRALEEELEEMRQRSGNVVPNWRASMRRMQESWALMPPERQAEFTEVFEQAEREARAIRVDDP